MTQNQTTQHDDNIALAAEYVLGTLDLVEREEAERLIANVGYKADTGLTAELRVNEPAGELRTGEIDLHGVIDDEVDGHERLDLRGDGPAGRSEGRQRAQLFEVVVDEARGQRDVAVEVRALAVVLGDVEWNLVTGRDQR